MHYNVVSRSHEVITNSQTFHDLLMRVLEVLKEGRMDIIGFLDTLCWETLSPSQIP